MQVFILTFHIDTDIDILLYFMLCSYFNPFSHVSDAYDIGIMNEYMYMYVHKHDIHTYCTCNHFTAISGDFSNRVHYIERNFSQFPAGFNTVKPMRALAH